MVHTTPLGQCNTKERTTGTLAPSAHHCRPIGALKPSRAADRAHWPTQPLLILKTILVSRDEPGYPGETEPGEWLHTAD